MENQLENSEHSSLSANLTHSIEDFNLEKSLLQLQTKIVQRGDLPYVTVQEQLQILNELAGFELGRFLIVNHGLNGYWTDYILKHPQKGRISGLNSNGLSFSNIETFLLDHALTVRATQERFVIFKNELQHLFKDGVIMASVPCGVMSDLLDLNSTGIQDFKFIGCDIDPYSINEASRRASALGLDDKVIFIQEDAWHLKLIEKVDVITSNGLNIYEPDENRVLNLYKIFFDCLKDGGFLITSFLTKPPGNPDSEWNLTCLNLADAQKQKIIFSDVLGVSWQSFRSSQETFALLAKAGFTNIRLIFDSMHIFPTVIAQKPAIIPIVTNPL